MLFLSILIFPVVSEAKDLQTVVKGLSEGLGGLGAYLATIGFIVAGILFVASSANPQLMTQAKHALIAAIVGVVILLLATGAQDFIKSLFKGAF